MEEYDFEGTDHKFTKERGNLLATSVPHLNKWITNGDQLAKSCLIKLYDSNINEFKLNEIVTFIGILEFNKNRENEQ